MSSDVGTPYAGERLADPTLTCPTCGRAASPEAAFCAFCGAGLAPQRVAGYPVFAAIAAAITGRTAYDVLSRVGGIFEELGAVFEGVPEAPGTLVALFPPKEDAATAAARAALRARATAPEVRLGLDASEVTERSDQDATWQFLIDRGVRLQAMAHDGEIVAGETLPALTEGAAVVEALDPAGGPVLLRSIRDRNPVGTPTRVETVPTTAPVEAAPARGPVPEPVAVQVERAPAPGPVSEAVPEPAPEATSAAADPPIHADEVAEAAPSPSELLEHLDELRRTVTGVAVVGEPGTGRSRLVRTFAAQHVGPTVTVDARGGPTAPWPLAALVQAIVAAAATETPTQPPGAGDGPRNELERILAGASDRDRVVKRLMHALGLEGGEPAADETRWAFRRLLGSAFAQPVLIVVVDVDHVAFGFTTFLTEVARAVRDLPVFVVVSAVAAPDGVDAIVRLEAVPEDPPLAATTSATPPTELAVDEVAVLPEEAVSAEDLIGSAAHAADAGDAAGAAVLERRAAALLTPEDPRRAELCFEAAAHLADAGLRKDAEVAIAEGLALTGGGEEAVGWRLRLLRATLRAGDNDEIDPARATTDEAFERCIALGDRWGAARALALRAVVHRARGHAAAVVADLTEAAEHAGAAGRRIERRSAVRGVADALLDGPFGGTDAIARCEALVTAGDLGRTTEESLRGALAVLLARAGRADEARPMVAGAVATLDELDAVRDLTIALHRAGTVAWLNGELTAAGAAFERAAAVAERAHEDPLLGCIAASRANLLPVLDPDATEGADAALALAELASTAASGSDTPTQVAWRTGRARALARLGRHAEADRAAREAVSLAEQTDSVDLRANALLYLAEVLEAAGRPVEAASFRARATRLLSRTGAIATAAVPRRDPA